MKALSSTVAGNIVPAVSYTAGSYTLTGFVVGNYYYYSMGTNDTSIAFASGATFAKSAAATGVFAATAISATLAGSGTSAVGTVVAPMLSIPLFPATVTPTLPARLVTVGQFPPNNPNFSRQLQISDQYVFVKRGTYAVAISLNDICSMALNEEVNLTWTPPAILTEPANASCAHSSTSASFVALAGSEYTMTYAWYESADGVTYGSALTTTGIYNVATAGTLTITPTNTAKNGYYYKCVVTDNAGSFGLTNGSSTFSVVKLTVT